ncbi:hypothetical protein KY334_02480, partial [Candidatus Woesearchaeota archaeon]|nr:hypothetical protein [Candidatus Woesearchaeota archaeon]
FTRKVLDDVGLFSEEYLEASGEDLDMLYKLHEKNYGVYIQPKVFIFHEGGATGKLIDNEKLDRMYDRNWKLFLNKWSKYRNQILDKV